MSKSTLSRLENGSSFTLSAARALDASLATGGLIESELHRTSRRIVPPPVAQTYFDRRDVEHCWPADFSGAVWIHLRLASHEPSRSWRVVFRWGPWSVGRSIPATVREVTFVTGKSTSEVAVPLWVQTSVAADVTFGCDEPGADADGQRVDLRDAWVPRPGKPTPAAS